MSYSPVNSRAKENKRNVHCNSLWWGWDKTNWDIKILEKIMRLFLSLYELIYIEIEMRKKVKIVFTV